MEKEKNDLKDCALQYRDLGYSVIPLAMKKKFPIRGLKEKEYQTRHPTFDEIRTWWKEKPNSNVGIVTGELSGCFVLDVDTEDGHEFVKKKGIPLTASVQTGKGYQYYSKYPDFEVRNKNHKVKDWGCPGCDIRGEGGLVVAPPSIHPNGKKYRWMQSPRKTQIAEAPEWLLGLLRNPGQPVSIELKSVLKTSGNEKSIGEFWLEKHLLIAEIGNRSVQGFHLGCQLRDSRLSQDEAIPIMIEYAKRVPNSRLEKYTIKEALKALNEAYKEQPREPASSNSQLYESTFENRTRNAVINPKCDLKGMDRSMMMALSVFANWKGENAIVSYDTLGKYAGCNRNTVRKSTERLVEKGWLEIEKRYKGFLSGECHHCYKLILKTENLVNSDSLLEGEVHKQQQTTQYGNICTNLCA